MERANSLIESEWPTASLTELRDHERMERAHLPDQINQPLFALIKARKALYDAKLSISAAKRWFGDKENVRERLDSISAAIEREHDRFPLTVLQGVDHRPRPSIMQHS